MSEDEEDWFERALRESDEEASAETESDADSDEAASEEAEEEPVDVPDIDDVGGFEDLGSGGGGGGADSESPFDQDFASAFESAPDISEGSGGESPFGGEGPDMGSGGPPGMGGESTSEPFADEDADFDSAIDRIDLGVEGLDNMILGGVPTRSLISVIGSAGTGKTTFGLQFLNEALSNGQRGVYLSLEETTDRIYDTAAEKGWPFREYADEGRLAVVHLDPVEMANSLSSIRSELPELIEEFGADRLVLDSVSLLEMMYDRASDRRSEVYQFSKALKDAGVTTLVVSEASSDSPYNSRYGIIEYLADAVFILQYVRASDFQETRLAVEIQKIRDANHSRETKPYEITDSGLSVYRQANIF
ncbi:KaiC domain-containing protein [Haloplanus sp. C73]|uniref:KaiC domain-containing protein n=1 Tax=Haloplanus sp. C73 TaxID=3421641 RepID=UPI003EBB354A